MRTRLYCGGESAVFWEREALYRCSNRASVRCWYYSAAEMWSVSAMRCRSDQSSHSVCTLGLSFGPRAMTPQGTAAARDRTDAQIALFHDQVTQNQNESAMLGSSSSCRKLLCAPLVMLPQHHCENTKLGLLSHRNLH